MHIIIWFKMICLQWYIEGGHLVFMPFIVSKCLMCESCWWEALWDGLGRQSPELLQWGRSQAVSGCESTPGCDSSLSSQKGGIANQRPPCSWDESRRWTDVCRWQMEQPDGWRRLTLHAYWSVFSLVHQLLIKNTLFEMWPWENSCDLFGEESEWDNDIMHKALTHSVVVGVMALFILSSFMLF